MNEELYKLMAERADLIVWKCHNALNEQQSDRLAFLNREAIRLAPRVTPEMLEQLATAEACLDKHARSTDTSQ